MDLLNQNQYEEPKQIKGKKVIITLLIISIIALIIIVALMVFLSANKTIKDTLYINNVQYEISDDMIVSDNEGNKYISLKELSTALGYEYYNSEYGNYGIDINKCYIKNKNLISGFEAGNNKMYKYEEGTNLDYQYYTLYNDIVIYNGKMYISIQDLAQAINVYCTIAQDNQIQINTMEYMATAYQERLRPNGYTVVTEQNNQKSLAYGFIIVKKDGMYGVLNHELQEILGLKYSSIYFDEFNQNYIVSNENRQYGIISTSGEVQHSLRFDEINILNYENMLYKVKYNEKYGIMKIDGTMLTEIAYDEIGYQPEPENKISYTLIIPELDGKSGKTIVVKNNGYYGLITLEKGEVYLPCDHVEKLYALSELGELNYKIEAEGYLLDLTEYLTLREIQI